MNAMTILGGNGTAVCAGAVGVQACVVDYYGTWPWQQQGTYQPVALPEQHTHYHFTPAQPAPLSDADIERIARRVAELLKG